MARCKSSPEVVRAKCELAHRLKEVRTEQYGERGGPELARRLNLPIRTWYNYETGVTVPSEVLLRFIELTEVEPRWLLHGQGAKFRKSAPALDDKEDASVAPGSVADLLRRALVLLEQQEDQESAEVVLPHSRGLDPQEDQVIVHVERPGAEGAGSSSQPSLMLPIKRDWIAGNRRFRCLTIQGNEMAPILLNGAVVAVADRPEDPEDLNGEIVATRIRGEVMVRWLQVAGRVALLRAEDESFEPEVVPLSVEDEEQEVPLFRRVLWASTPH